MEVFVPMYSIEQCLSELIANSLQSKANAIAIRFHASERRLQVIDNGCGIPEGILYKVGELAFLRSEPSIFPRSYIFHKIRFRADSCSITSKTSLSKTTYVKNFQKDSPSTVIIGTPRPCLGTTVTINGLNFPFSQSDKYVINNTVAIYASFFPTVSFSVRDDEVLEVSLRIGKPHRSEKIIEYVCNEELQHSWYLEITTDPHIHLKAHVGLMQQNSHLVKKVYVNSKLATNTEIEILLQTILQRCYDVWLKGSPAKNLFYIVYVECPITEFDFYVIKDKLSVKIKNNDLMRKLKSQLKEKVVGTFLNVSKSKCRQPEWRILNRRNQQSKQKKKMTPRLKTFSPILRRRIIFHQKARKSFFVRSKIKKTPVRIPKDSEWISEDEHIEVIEKQSSAIVIEESSEHVVMEVQKSDFTQISRVSSLTLEVEKHRECNEMESIEDQQPENQKNLDDFAIGSQISLWSDWNVELPTNVHKITINNVTYYYPQVEEVNRNFNTYSIIPQNLKDLLRYKNKNLVENHFIFSQEESQKQICFDELFSKKPRGFETRITERTGMISEFKLYRKSLENIKIINQVNLEFIAAVTVEDNKKYLLLIDQHAVDERIRYEQLLEVYRVSGTRDEYISVLLETPIIVTDVEEKTYRVLNANQELFKKYGVTYSLENTKVIVRSIPLCFKGRKYWNDDLKLIAFVRKLFAEVVESVANTNGAMVLPSSIHLAIATEACRGAIKFGDPLNVDQCEYLMKTLNYTNGFSRCAHGRPSIIPLLDITSLSTGSRKQPKKLNYASLTRVRKGV